MTSPLDRIKDLSAEPADAKEFAGGPWRCYVVARVKLKNKSGEAFKYGVYNTKTNSHAAVESAGMEIAGDEKYHAYGFRLSGNRQLAVNTKRLAGE